MPLAAYWLSLAPSITWRNGGIDSGDTATGVAALGILHPPGYALFVVLGHLFTRAMPWLEPAPATNLFCALIGSASALLVFVTCRDVLEWIDPPESVADRSPVAPFVALTVSLCLVLGPLWWQQSNLTTVHAPNILLAALVCWFVAKAFFRGLRPIDVGLAAFVLGLATTHHLTLLAVPLSAGIAIAVTRREAPTGLPDLAIVRLGAVAVGAYALGLWPWLALPLIAAAQPRHVWGDPTTLAGFVDIVLARQYQEYLNYATPLGLLYRFAAGVWVVARELGPVGFPAALAGCALLWDHRRRYVVFWLALAVVNVAFFARYSARDVESYLLPTTIAAAPAAAIALRALVDAIASGRRWRLAAVAALGALVALVAGVGLSWQSMNLSGDREAIDYARTAIAEAPTNALVLTETDKFTFALWYAHTGLGLRPDTAVVDRWMLRYPWYREHVRRMYPDLRIPADGALTGAALASGAITDRPVVVTHNNVSWGTSIEAGQHLHRIVPALRAAAENRGSQSDESIGQRSDVGGARA